jgi:tetratricopeptide (TPR) repeat protein
MLKKDPKDATVLYILSGIHADLLNNPKRAAELTERLAQTTKDTGGKVDARLSSQLAVQYVKSGKFKQGAELYEELASSDAKSKSQHLKDAAVAWLKAGEKEKACAAAKAAAAGPPDDRSKLLTHFWHRQLGDVFLATGEYRLAIEHLEKAAEKTDIEGYRKDCQKKIEQAKQKLAM